MPIDPELQLNQSERASLVAYLRTEGFAALQKLCVLQIAEFDLALKNTDPSEEKKVLAAHVISKAASQFYAGLINRINEEDAYFRAEQPQKTTVEKHAITDILTEE